MPQLGTSTLGRKKGPRKALLLQATRSLIKHKRIVTTQAKAKMIARYIAPIITKARTNQEKDPLHAKREAFRALTHKATTQLLLKEVVPQVGDRKGGYTRIISLARRPGDAAKMAMIELVDYNTIYTKKKKTKTTRRSRKKSATTAETTSLQAPTPQATPSTSEATPANAESTPSTK